MCGTLRKPCTLVHSSSPLATKKVLSMDERQVGGSPNAVRHTKKGPVLLELISILLGDTFI